MVDRIISDRHTGFSQPIQGDKHIARSRPSQIRKALDIEPILEDIEKLTDADTNTRCLVDLECDRRDRAIAMSQNHL